LSGRSWLALAALLGLGALLAFAAGDAKRLDWQPALAWQQPWRWWSAAVVHWSRLHLLANLGGLALVAALGVLARVDAATTLAWLLAWPLTQLGLALRPDLVSYGGLSGVLHAGVVIVAWRLLRGGEPRAAAVGAALIAGVALKLWLEAPWGPALQLRSDWDVPIAPFAHLSGAVSGAFAALLTERALWARWRPHPR
jgi:rhomboid family GlyGly-CTERM serine protease